MSLRRKHLGTDRETIAGLVTILTPIARRLATDKELRNELRSAADSLAGAYRRTRGDHAPRPAPGSGRVHAYEEPAGGGRRAGSPVAAEIIDDGGVPRRRTGTGRALRVGLAAAAAAGATVALLAGRHARHLGSRRGRQGGEPRSD